MQSQTHFAHLLDTAAARAKYDECVKNLLAHKVILAWILKRCTKEFCSYPIDYIVKECIESTPEVASRAVHSDERDITPASSPDQEYIQGMNTEDTRILEGTVTFDIRFTACVPGDPDPVQLILNIEAQLDANPGYPLSKRALYYCCRMISAQYGTLFRDAEYDKLRKVYSIWICPTPSERTGNTIQQLSIAEEDVLGNLGMAETDYDLMTVILLRLGKKGESSEDELIRMLSILLSSSRTPEEKKQLLKEKFKIPMTTELDTEVQNMCNLSEGIWMEGKEEGIKEGREEGIILGAIKAYREMELDDEQIITKVSKAFQLSRKKAEEYLMGTPA